MSCAVAASLAKRIAELEKLVSTDSLTGLWNRAHFDRLVAAELDRSKRYRQPLSLILFDIDRFKTVNDLHGHLCGDAVLQELASLATTALRSTDLVFRWGGEEFAVLATSTGHRGAQRLAEILRAQVERHRFPVVGEVTISVGVAEHLATEGPDEWFGRVDAMLYAAKEAGRNRLRVDPQGSSDAWAGEAGSAPLHLAWLEAYECGEPSIDDEHRELIVLANELIQASIGGKKGDEGFALAFGKLFQHASHHFASEEVLLEQIGYAKLDAHRRAHAGLLERAIQLKTEFEDGHARLGEVVEFLANDLVARHLFAADRDFFPLFKTAN